jgi:hypothetical protein
MFRCCCCCCCCREFPGQLTKILEWFRDYKIPDGKPANAFGYDNKCMDKAFTLKVGCSHLLSTCALCLCAHGMLVRNAIPAAKQRVNACGSLHALADTFAAAAAGCR